jgi:uncharacterized protein YecT (DUF1311 family)
MKNPDEDIFRKFGRAVCWTTAITFIALTIYVAAWIVKTPRSLAPAEPVAADVTPAPNALPAPNVSPAPQAEKDLFAIVERYARSYEAAPNDMAKGALRPRRAADLCGLLLSDVTGWIGRITTLSSNNEGNGVLELRLSESVSVGTWNNSFSDFEDHTLISAGSPLHQAAVALQEGQLVTFSGHFFHEQNDCLKEKSLTVAGAMTDPAFLFQFSDIRPAESAPAPSSAQPNYPRASQPAPWQPPDALPSPPVPAALNARADPFDDWCKTAKLPSSIAICSDPELLTLARERQHAYDEAKANLSPAQQKALLADQNAWVKSYSVACGLAQDAGPVLPLAPEIEQCMARAGRARIVYLRGYAAPSTAAIATPPRGPAPLPRARTSRQSAAPAPAATPRLPSAQWRAPVSTDPKCFTVYPAMPPADCFAH